MNSDTFSLDCCLKSNYKQIDNIPYSEMIFSCDSSFQGKFVQFDDDNFKRINEFIFNLVEAYFLNRLTNRCKRIELKLISYNKNFISFIMKVMYEDFFKYKSLIFDSKTKQIIPHKIFLKRIKIKKRNLSKMVKKVDKKLNIKNDTFYIFNNDLKFFCHKKADEKLTSFRIKICEN